MQLKYFFPIIIASVALSACTAQEASEPTQQKPEVAQSQASATPAPDQAASSSAVPETEVPELSGYEKMEQEALAGDYISQRNIAYTLSREIPHNPILGCAWRIVIVESGSPKVDQTDTGNMSFECGKLSADELTAAKAQAKKLQEKIREK